MANYFSVESVLREYQGVSIIDYNFLLNMPSLSFEPPISNWTIDCYCIEITSVFSKEWIKIFYLAMVNIN